MSTQSDFLDCTKHIAFYGLKRSGSGFAHDVQRGIQEYRPNLNITAIHPEAAEIGGLTVQRSASELEPVADAAVVVLSSDAAHYAIDDALAGGIKRIWLVMNAASATNREHAQSLGAEVICGCPLLFIPGLGFPHNLHRWLAGLFGRL